MSAHSTSDGAASKGAELASSEGRLSQPPAIILVEPQLGENIGAAARAMGNFGLSDLRIVNPRDGWPNPRAVANSAGVPNILENARLFDTTQEAIGDLNYVFATTARARTMRKRVMTPETLAEELFSDAVAGTNCGILFGHEASGLSNEDAVLADALVTVPVSPDFASINLAQSVLLIGYEWRKRINSQTLGRATDFDGPAVPGMPLGDTKIATRDEVFGFFEHFEGALDDAQFLWPPEKRPKMVQNLRNMFFRMQLTQQDVKTLRGVVAALTRFRGGLK